MAGCGNQEKLETAEGDQLRGRKNWQEQGKYIRSSHLNSEGCERGQTLEALKREPGSTGELSEAGFSLTLGREGFSNEDISHTQPAQN